MRPNCPLVIFEVWNQLYFHITLCITYTYQPLELVCASFLISMGKISVEHLCGFIQFWYVREWYMHAFSGVSEKENYISVLWPHVFRLARKSNFFSFYFDQTNISISEFWDHRACIQKLRSLTWSAFATSLWIC